MRFSKEFWIWLIETQIEEIEEHNDKMKLANEFADIIGIAVQAIQELTSEDMTKEIIAKRIGRNINRIPEIAFKYRNKWIEYESQDQDKNKDRREK